MTNISSQGIFFLKGSENSLKKTENEDDTLSIIRDSFAKVLDGKNLSFLLGSGCSSYQVSGKEVGILTMKPLAQKFYKSKGVDTLTKELLEKFGLDVSQDKFQNNLEFFLSSLHSIEYFYDSLGIKDDNKINEEKLIKDTIAKVKEFLVGEILNPLIDICGDDKPLKLIYEQFYRKLLYRNSHLPKPNIFTTNYDLYSELTLDRLGIHFVNGFSGGIQKYFNPTIFNYALAERMDISQSKWNVIDNFFYLYKIHGSVNWIEDNNGSKLFKVKEVQDTSEESLKDKNQIMIYPTPLKQNASLGSPYSDLFREFQKKLMQTNNVLITIGYSFSDEHVNNLIYQAFTIPSFRLIVLGNPATGTEIEKLKLLNDPRIWIIGGNLSNGDKLHYFKGFVNNILPDLNNDEIDSKIENAIKTLLSSSK